MNVISHKKIWNRLFLSIFMFAVVLTTYNVLMANNAASASSGKKETKKTTKSKPVAKQFTNSIGMKIVLIPAGEFQMGSPNSEKDRHPNEDPQHKVKITKPFYMAATEVTQKQWKAVMGTTPWKSKKFVKEGDDYPATYISWNDAQNFIKKLNKKEGMTYRLPTEAEWEYACRAGSTTKYSFGNDEKLLGSYAWCRKNTWDANEKYAHRVAQKRANGWGLYDMHGNVGEWCEDQWHHNYKGAPTDSSSAWPPAWAFRRVYRGGGWLTPFGTCRSAFRNRNAERDSLLSYLGFRVAASPGSVP